jgi:xanthine dehydrogenase accessory factor
MLEQLLKQSAELLAKGETFAMATVVRCQAPSSGKPGDKAIIQADGRLSGWIGGGCAQPVAIREALKALADGKPRLVRISPAAEGAEEGVVDYTMTCHSGGSLDIYIEPVVPNLHIVILGRSHVARTLARLGRATGYDVSVIVPTADVEAEGFGEAQVIVEKDFNLSGLRLGPRTFIVVSTQGEGDEEALEKAAFTAGDVPYVAFVASKIKAGKVLDYLRARGVPAEKLQLVRAPAGLDLGAGTPEEIAVSILAEIVQVRGAKAAPPQQRVDSNAPATPPVVAAGAKDPICGMLVDPSQARHKSEYQGRWFYFCCAGCQREFDQAPAKHAAFAVD